jgi:glycosyltransferase involved in cell wall biosynthesis
MLTVLMATHNGADTLGRTLDAFAKMVEPYGGWKLVIVNNASTDATDEIVRSRMATLPIEYILEPRLGKPAALNSGLQHIAGDLVVFADDDVIPRPDWLVEWRRVADAYPGCSVFGGAIVPEFETPPPRWLSRTNWSLMLYSATTPDRAEGPMSGDALEVFGPNMAVRIDVVMDGVRFDDRFMTGSIALLGDETDFVNRALERGFKACFAPSAVVRHLVNASQITWRWMLRRFYRHGRTMRAVELKEGIVRVPEIAGVPRYLIKRLCVRAATLPLSAARLDRFALISHLRLIAYDLGAARQSWLARRVARA